MMRHKVLQLLVLVSLIPVSGIVAQENYKEKDAKLQYQNKEFYDVKSYSNAELKRQNTIL